jgi:outer membrane protein
MTAKKYFIFTSLVLLAPALFAQDSLHLKLDNAIALSLKNSKQLRISQSHIDQASALLQQAKDARLPDVKVNGSWLQLNHPNVNLNTKSATNTGSGTEVARPSSAVFGMATASLPVYAGSRIKYGIEAAHFLEEAMKLDAEHDKGKIMLNTINAYTNLYKALTAVKLVNDNLVQSQQRDKDFSNLEKNGLLARNDLLKAQLQTSNIELELVNAENNLRLSMVSLNLIMGLPERTILSVDTSSIQSATDIKSIENYEQLALSNRKDIRATAMRHEAATVQVKEARSEYYPSIGLTGGYIAADIPKLLTVTNALNIGVGVQYNLGSLWKTKSKIQQAKAVENELAANQEILEDNIRMDINQAYEDYFSAKKRNEVQANAVENAKENYRITKNKYDNNLVTTTELLDASTALLEARINLENAKADIFSAFNTLQQRSGLLVSDQINN